MKTVNYYLEIGKTLKKLRMKKGLSNSQLSEGICSASYISRIENGDRCPTSVILRQLTNRLGVSPEYLFSLIESPNSVMIKSFITEIITYSLRGDYKNVSRLLKINNIIEVYSDYDNQILSTMEYLSDSIINNDFTTDYDKIDSVINFSDFETHTPSDTEFAMLVLKAQFLSMNNRTEEAYELYHSLRDFSKDISFLQLGILTKYYIYYSAASIDCDNVKDALKIVNGGIEYCKSNNILNPLRELYYLKGEIYYILEDVEKGKTFIENAFKLHELIKFTDSENFLPFALDRIKKFKTKYGINLIDNISINSEIEKVYSK